MERERTTEKEGTENMARNERIVPVRVLVPGDTIVGDGAHPTGTINWKVESVNAGNEHQPRRRTVSVKAHTVYSSIRKVYGMDEEVVVTYLDPEEATYHGPWCDEPEFGSCTTCRGDEVARTERECDECEYLVDLDLYSDEELRDGPVLCDRHLDIERNELEGERRREIASGK
jgi:hypothetical protein